MRVLVLACLGVAGATRAQTNAPSVAIEPVGGTGSVGETFAFSAGVAGMPPFAFQWLLNGPIPGATNTSLLLTNLSSANAGDYQVVVTNGFGSVTSSVATLRVVSGAPRVLWVQDVAPFGGDGVKAPLVFNGNGREGAIEFSLQFDTNTFDQNLNYSWASGVGATVVSSNIAVGQIGFHLFPTSSDLFPAGQQTLGSVQFTLQGTNATFLDGQLAFSGQPVPIQAVDTNQVQMLLSAAVVPQIEVNPEQPKLNRTNGLYEQTLTVANPSANTFVNLPVYVPWLGLDTATNPMTLYNASGKGNADLNGDGALEPIVTYTAANGTTVVVNKPVAFFTVPVLTNGASVTLTSELYVSDHVTAPLVDYYVGVGGTAGIPMPATLAPLTILGASFEGSDFVLEWPTRSGQSYTVHYADDLAGLGNPGSVQSSTNTITGTGHPVQWVDPAPAATQRFYQVVESP